jgi:hypothetical protein
MPPELPDSPEYLAKLARFLTGQGLTHLEAGALSMTRTRTDLGIASLQVILLMVHYSEAAGDVIFRPEWVSRLEDVAGIVSVMREIDSLAPAPAGAA